jgi:hypothetical protein
MPAVKPKKVRHAAPAPARTAPKWRPKPVWMALAAFALAVLVFYWIPLTDPNTTPQWDTIDYHYSVQKFAAEELRSFRLPHWSEFSYSGFPFLADPQVGVWYPLNWPFFLAGITPKALQWEIALHIWLACFGAWLLAGLWIENPWCAALAGVLYGFSGFFAGHASHLGMLQTAAWLPLVLYGVHRSMRSRSYVPTLLTGAGCALLFLAGHFQSAVYSFAAIGLYAVVVAGVEKRWRSALTVLAVCATVAVLLSAIQWLPTMELAGQSVRAGVTYEKQTNAALEPRSLWTLISPNHYGSVDGNYSGPADRTQFYFYGGLALLPLALLGVIFGRVRWVALPLVLLFGWYACGPTAGLYQIAARLPGIGSVRAPVHAWFVVALGLALLAGAGLAAASARVKFKWLAAMVAVISFADVFYWNSAENTLAYYRGSFENRYGIFQDNFERTVRQVLPEGTRFYSPFDSPSYGPLNGTYDVRMPVTYGSNPLPLRRYTAYIDAAAANPALLNGLAAGALVVPNTAAVMRNANMLPRFFFPKSIEAVTPAQSAAKLATSNPAVSSSVEGDITTLRQDPTASAAILSSDPGRYVIRTEVKSESLLRAAIPWYPAWQATVDGNSAPLRVVDHALMGVVVPAGRHEVTLAYNPAKFRLGAAISFAALGLMIAAFVFRRRFAPQSPASSPSITT